MNWLETIIIAIVEGLTEFLPISSTGHMIIAESILGVEPDDFVKAFTVIIQFGAILSVLVLYWKRFFQSFDFYWKLFVAFIPAAILGFLFSDEIDALLESVQVVAMMLIVGGILMLFVDKWFEKTSQNQTITYRKAFIIGICQCIAMIPGVSRSMATIVGGMSQQLTRKRAAEFSFFLAVPTMFAASAYKLVKLLSNPESKQLLMNNIDILIVGNIVAFIVAIAAIKFFIEFIGKYGFKAFGYYRIIVGSVLLGLLFLGYNLQIG
ncbi:MAG: undecaprenyl-diphosphate phosphatase [Dysgonamonadaceae bacterium]|jgi:undecaprenyl-diphosphatase|nr:undecaprenyl-diphosphate phosphatase [Dysgonamonadaceae bacterium]